MHVKISVIIIPIVVIGTISLAGCSTTTHSARASNNTTNVNSARGHKPSPTGSLGNLTDTNYFSATDTADKFLNDWRQRDAKDGIALLTANAKQGKSIKKLKQYFSHVPPGHSGYEVIGYKKLSQNEFAFHVWMYRYVMGAYGPHSWSRPDPKTLTVVKHNGSWHVDNLPYFKKLS